MVFAHYTHPFVCELLTTSQHMLNYLLKSKYPPSYTEDSHEAFGNSLQTAGKRPCVNCLQLEPMQMGFGIS